MEALISLFKKKFGCTPEQMKLLPASGSARNYYRIYGGEHTCIGTYNLNVQENQLFIDFSKHFKQKGFRVPEIYGVSEDRTAYLQEDLGDRMLLDERRATEGWDDRLTDLYRKALAELLRFQILGTEGLDYSHCLPRPVFDRRCMLWDLNYFKYCFLRLAGVDFSEDALENDFEKLVGQLSRVQADTFMFRDFQSRNIMVRAGDVWFIDYQGGRRGALHYDVASLLYDAVAGIPDSQREALLEHYINGLREYRAVDTAEFRRDYYRFVLMRLLQALGAFGLRGLYERKQDFIDSIRPGLWNVEALFHSGKLRNDFPEIHRLVTGLCQPGSNV